jgi:hypothetical protein
VPESIRGVLKDCPVGGGGAAATIDPEWGEPGLTAAEKIYGWNSFIVLAMTRGAAPGPRRGGKSTPDPAVSFFWALVPRRCAGR